MKAIVVTDQATGTAGMTLVERPEPPAAINDVVGLVSYLASAYVGLHLGQLWAAGDRRFALHLARIWHAPPPASGAVLDLRRGNVAFLPRPSPGCLDL
jgi:hypothetical protein